MIKLAGYKILKKIGSGGMGDVYLAEHEKLKKQVAIKSLHKNLVSNTDFRKRFEKEAQTHSKLDHPNIVKLLDYKEQKDGLFLIMEYVDGKQLDEHIKKVTGPIPEKELTTLFTQVLDAIGYAHDEGLVHRDIKPSNIMIDKRGRIKVLDFGIAKLQEEDKGLTKTGVQMGTVSYMSPEQVNAKKLDKLTDIYSLGVTLFHMAVGKSPYSEDTNTFTIQEKIVREPFPIASETYPGVSERFEKIIKKATQKKKKDRYQNCEDFKDDLNTIKKDKKIVEEGNNSLKNILKRKSYLIILLFFSILYVVTSIIDNNTYRPDFLLSEFTVVAAFFVLVTLFSIKAVSRKYKIKKIIAREILYLICSSILAAIMFGIHSYVYNSYDKTITEIEDAISKCKVNVSNLKSQEDYNLSNLSELGFNPLEKEYYISELSFLREHLKEINGVQYISAVNFHQFSNTDEYDRIIDQIGGFNQLSSITNERLVSIGTEKNDKVYFDDLIISLGRTNYILGDIKLKKKNPIYESYLRTFYIGSTTSKADVKRKYGINITKSNYSNSPNINGYKDDKYGECYFDKKKQYFIRTNARSGWENSIRL